MITYSLSGVWQMEETNGRITEGTVPGSVYSFLLNAGLMEDPYYRENELAACGAWRKISPSAACLHRRSRF